MVIRLMVYRRDAGWLHCREANGSHTNPVNLFSQSKKTIYARNTTGNYLDDIWEKKFTIPSEVKILLWEIQRTKKIGPHANVCA